MKNPGLECVEAVRGGDEAAAARWVEDYHERLYAFLRRLAGTDAAAAELTQRTFCRAWSALDSYQGRASISSWLHGIAYRVYVDWLRSDRRYEGRSEAWWEGIRDQGTRPDAAASAADDETAVYAAVDALGSGLREAVHLHYYQGLTLQETAEALGVATSTVKYRLRDAMDQIQRRLGVPRKVSKDADDERAQGAAR
ncbi:MAG: RNA polymerase sigma factor [Verrucomicrobiales bacterium]|nr:RNA polymerase sigma factor [Verrucomicrobiales bacterium]